MVLVFELLGFVVPLWSFHVELQNQKLTFLKEADTLSEHIASTRAQLAAVSSESELKILQAHLARQVERCAAIEHMPVWPVDTQIRRRLAVNNITLLVPLFAKWVDASGTLKNIVNSIVGHPYQS